MNAPADVVLQVARIPQHTTSLPRESMELAGIHITILGYQYNPSTFEALRSCYVLCDGWMQYY